MITILSYHPGLSGDFLAYNIHQDKKYFNINENHVNISSYELYSNYLKINNIV